MLGSFFINVTAITEIYTCVHPLSLHDALPISAAYYSPGANFGGVEIAGVVRATDPYLDASARLTGNRLGSAATRAKWLNDTEAALNDTANGVGQLMTSMFSAAET